MPLRENLLLEVVSWSLVSLLHTPTSNPVVTVSSRLRLAVLPEDRLQMKWREAEGSGLGYLVQVTPMAGMESSCLPTRFSLLFLLLGLLEMGLGSQENEHTVQSLLFWILARHKVLLLQNGVWLSLSK